MSDPWVAASYTCIVSNPAGVNGSLANISIFETDALSAKQLGGNDEQLILFDVNKSHALFTNTAYGVGLQSLDRLCRMPSLKQQARSSVG